MRLFFFTLVIATAVLSFHAQQKDERLADFEEVGRLTDRLNLLRSTQKDLQNRQIQQLVKLKQVSKADVIEAEKLGAKAVRIFPCCEIGEIIKTSEVSLSDIPFEVSLELYGFEFSKVSMPWLFRNADQNNMLDGSSSFEFKDGELDFNSRNGDDHGLIVPLSATPFEKINEELPAFTALAEYRPPTEKSTIKAVFSSGGFRFTRTAKVKPAGVYLFRTIDYDTVFGKMDAIFAARARRIDKNGRIVLFIKMLKRFADPVMKNPEREEFNRIFSIGLKSKLRGIFDARGFTDVTIDVVDGIVYLSGSVPQGKNAEAVELVKSFYDGVKVESRLTEK